MDFTELRPDVNSELPISTRVARLARIVGRFARRYNLPGERRTQGGKRRAPSRRARCIISFPAQWALFAKVLKRGIKPNDHLLPELVAAVVQKSRRWEVGATARNSREGVSSDAAVHHSKAEEQKETRGREKDEPFYIMRHVSHELHGGGK